MWTSAAAKAAPEMDEAGVVIGDFRLASLVHEPADESERFQEEIRTLMMASDNTGPLELSGGTTCCYFTALLGLVSKSNEGTTTTGGEGVPVPTTPACVLPQLLSSSPTTEIFPPDTAPYSMFLAAPETGEKHLGVGGSPCATDSPEKVNTTGSDCGPEPPLELEAATGGQRKRCAKRKSKVKPPSSGKRKSKAAVLAAAREKETDSKEEEAAADNDLKCDAGDCGAVEEKVEKEKLPFVHVRARRGQATDRHSLAERARREKINARMKLLQDLVPGCNKISGTALVLEEIINHVQTLQRQVEILSMRLAAVNPRFDLSELDGFLDAADALAMLEVPPEAWDGCSEVPATTTLARQEDGCLWQHLQQHQVESADALIGPHHQQQQQQQVMMQVSSPSAWGREGTDHVRLFTTHEYQNHHLLRHGHGLGYESSNPAPSQVNQVKTEL